jgi:hypothetical protein
MVKTSWRREQVLMIRNAALKKKKRGKEELERRGVLLVWEILVRFMCIT